MKKLLVAMLVSLLVLGTTVSAPPVLAAAVPDDGSMPYSGYDPNPYTKDPTKLITQEYFGNEWVNTIPDKVKGKGGLVPSPWDHHGYIAGSPLRLTPATEIYDYFKQLAERSARVAMWDIGKTGGKGLPVWIVAISSEDTIARLEQYKENLQKLADPRKLGYPDNPAAADKAAEELITNAAKLKPIFWVLTKIHGTETGSAEMSMELAYRLAVEEREMFKTIRDNEIVFITDPNPDGTQMVADYVNKYIGTEWDGTRPAFYNYYTQHDNNRDTHTNSQPEQLALVQANNEWPAQVMLDIHESVFLLFTFSGMEPTFPTVDPITQTEWQWLAARELNQMEQFGMPGVWSYKYVNMYYPMYQIQMANLRNATGKFYEVWGRITPTTGPVQDATKQGLGNTKAQDWYWYSPMPYKLPKILWSFRNNINYSQTATLTTALEIAKNRETILRNYWTKAKNAVSAPGRSEIGASGSFTYPYAYVIPAGQKDMPDTITMINNLLDNGIEVATATQEFSLGGKSYPAGSFIIKMNQPYSRLVYALLEPQFYPANNPAPYDASGWQYGLIRDVEVYRVDDPAALNLPAEQIQGSLPLAGTVSAELSSGAYVVDHNSINNIVTLVFKLAEKGYTCYAAEEGEGDTVETGDIIIPAEKQGVYAELARLVRGLGLTMRSVESVGVARHELNVPRIALYHDWTGVQDGGWSRFTFEQYGVPYTIIQAPDVRAGNLREKYDVIFLPDVSAKNLKDGVKPGSVPDKVEDGPVLTEHRTGGLGAEGISALEEFVAAGGVLIANNKSCSLPLENNFVTGISTLSEKEYNSPGPLLKIKTSPTSPITYGADEHEYLYCDRSPVFTAPEDTVVASYVTDANEILGSGLLEGGDKLLGKAAIVVAPAKNGSGHVVLFGTDITYRWQAFGAFTYLWNTILNWDDLSR